MISQITRRSNWNAEYHILPDGYLNLELKFEFCELNNHISHF